MPSPHGNTRDLFGAALGTTDRPRIRVGIGGWTFAPWRKNFYPDGLAQRRELEYASRHVTAIEINGTFYGAQKPESYARWHAETPEGFVFSLKAPRDITYRKTLASTAVPIERFVVGGLAELGDRLGPILWQLPPFKRFDAGDLEAFLQLLPRELDGRPMRHVLEVRHDSFLCAEYLALARRYRVATVFTDSPDYPSFADLTGDFVYARLMRSRGDTATGYPDAELDAWAARARDWSEGREPGDLPRIASADPIKPAPHEVFLYFISAAKERNPAAAMALLSRLG